MQEADLAPAEQGGIAYELLRRPEIKYELLAGICGRGEGVSRMMGERIETEIKYEGYIARQNRMIKDVARHEKNLIPDGIDYDTLATLSFEAREKLKKLRPKNLGQAGRVPGVTPCDVAQLSIAIHAMQAKEVQSSKDEGV